MKLELLVTDAMKPIPEDIEILNNWEYVGIVTSDGGFADGDHMYLEGDEVVVKDWLRPFDGVWRQKPGTSAMMQEFEVVHIS